MAENKLGRWRNNNTPANETSLNIIEEKLFNLQNKVDNGLDKYFTIEVRGSDSANISTNGYNLSFFIKEYGDYSSGDVHFENPVAVGYEVMSWMLPARGFDYKVDDKNYLIKIGLEFTSDAVFIDDKINVKVDEGGYIGCVNWSLYGERFDEVYIGSLGLVMDNDVNDLYGTQFTMYGQSQDDYSEMKIRNDPDGNSLYITCYLNGQLLSKTEYEFHKNLTEAQMNRTKILDNRMLYEHNITLTGTGNNKGEICIKITNTNKNPISSTNFLGLTDELFTGIDSFVDDLNIPCSGWLIKSSDSSVVIVNNIYYEDDGSVGFTGVNLTTKEDDASVIWVANEYTIKDTVICRG